MIKLQVIGNLGRDATENLVSGKRVINFSVAHTEKYKDRTGNVTERTTWVSCSYWTEKTGILPYLRKGTQVYVEGIPAVTIYDRNDGSKAAELKLNVFSVQLLGAKQENRGSAPSQPQSGHPSTANADDITEPIDDLPF